MQIGTFRKGGVHSYIGKIDTFMLKAELSLEPINSSSDKAPDYEVLAGTTHVGVAFKKTSEKGNPYLSLVIDDPSFPKAIWANLLISGKDFEFPLMWERPKKQA